jgi:uncharacterized membrane protein YfcA
MFFDLGIVTPPPDVSIIGFAILCLVSFFASGVSSSLGLGGGVMTITALIYLMNPTAVIPVHAVIQANSNFFRALMNWRSINFVWILPFICGSFIGVIIGGQLSFNLPKHLIEGIIGLFIIYSLWGPKLMNFNKPSYLVAMGTGIFSSFATMFVGGTGPLVAPFIKATTADRIATVATHGAYMSIQHTLKILVFGILGFAFGPYMILIISMVICGVLGTWFGKYLLILMPEQSFNIGFNSILTILALKLLYSAISQLISPDA